MLDVSRSLHEMLRDGRALFVCVIHVGFGAWAGLVWLGRAMLDVRGRGAHVRCTTCISRVGFMLVGVAVCRSVLLFVWEWPPSAPPRTTFHRGPQGEHRPPARFPPFGTRWCGIAPPPGDVHPGFVFYVRRCEWKLIVCVV